MANGNSKMLTAEQKMQLRQPIDDYVGKIQRQIDDLREDGTEKVVSIQNTIDGIKRNRALRKRRRNWKKQRLWKPKIKMRFQN